MSDYRYRVEEPVYFIAYVVNDGRITYHNAQVRPLGGMINTILDVGRIENVLEKDRNYPKDSVTVISYQRMGS